jgi:hypothetical protein
MNLYETGSTGITDNLMTQHKSSTMDPISDRTIGVDQNTWTDVFRAYRIYGEDLSWDQQRQMITYLMQSHPLSGIIVSVIKSSRNPYQIMKMAGHIGMYIPVNHRVGFILQLVGQIRASCSYPRTNILMFGPNWINGTVSG